jgi:hypothetical protein
LTSSILLCLAIPAIAAANGPAWVAELSDTSPARSDTVAVTIPIGSHVAVGVYNTDAVQPQPTAGVAATVRVLWLEHRTVFTGLAGEREAAVPYYLPSPAECAPTGFWVVELSPNAVGTYTVPIVCNTNTVTVELTCINLPPSDIGYGFYTDHHRFPDLARESEYDADMAAHGMTTFTPYARELLNIPTVDNKDYAQTLAWHIDTAIDAGLVDQRWPLLCLAIEPKDIQRAREFARHEWPELVGYNYDEPAREKGAEVAEYAQRWHAVGARTGTAIDGAIAQDIGGPLDIWVLHMDSMSQAAVTACADQGKTRWLYNCSLRGSNAALHRYWTGVYTWAQAPEVCLTWTYTHDPKSRINPDGTWNLLRVYDTATCDRNGLPLPTVALEGLQEGIIDSRLLQELTRRNTPEGNAYLAKLRRQVPLTFWPDGKDRTASSYVWDIPDLAVPPVDLVAMRREVLRLLGEGGV